MGDGNGRTETSKQPKQTTPLIIHLAMLWAMLLAAGQCPACLSPIPLALAPAPSPPSPPSSLTSPQARAWGGGG